jgi:hopanoid biosynthesis associated radical SAM protein HpnH
MRFPLKMSAGIAGYLVKKKLARTERFPMVLMLEPLHACNLTCTGCGRIREYESTIKQKLTIPECLAAVDECGAPVVSICGGEPMIYPAIGELVAQILARKKVVYLCTNGMFIRKKIGSASSTPRRASSSMSTWTG